ncbi:MAG TPA: MraY family glycosyltransferase [Tepidisphaeraceae bacterium]|nr:MraY family glycosyltransferase [Tepidisphaeraceae bacterium]
MVDGTAVKQFVIQPMTWDQVLSPYIYVLYISFLITLIFTPIMRMVALHYGIIDNPDKARKLHARPIAYLGGVAVFLGWIAGLAVSTFLRLHTSDPSQPQPVVMKFSIVSGACIIVLLGLWDDILSIRPIHKIAGQVFAAIFLLLDGIGTRCFQPILDPISHALTLRFGLPPIPDVVVVGVSCVAVVLLVVGCCNASNLIDGLDGLCGGVTAIISGGLLFLAIHLAMYGGGLNANWDGIRVVVALALMGAVLGFVPYNFNPASIFMGDTGSMFLGFVCAVLIILMGQGQHPKWFLASMVMFALPVLDTALAFARRWINGRPVFSPDKYHFHHQLLSRGFTVRQTVLISYGLAFFFALMGASIVLVRTRYSLAFWLIIFSYIIVAAYKMGMIHERSAVDTPGSLAKSEQEMTIDVEDESVLEIPESPETLQSSAEADNSEKPGPDWDAATAASRS